ncbi:MAG: FAD-dependent oxidoreductase [Ruminococcaceae bacterium]|nr:FAD-dependent oxidoreductase [Oscillospiraceae bacterium]
MNNYIEETKQIPQVDTVDVLVCGGGPAGIGAAIRAAEQGVSVMIVESQGCLGGVATAGMMSHWGGKSNSQVFQELTARSRLADLGYSWIDENEPGYHSIPHDVQMIVLEEMMKERGVKILYYTIVCDAVVEDGRIQGVIIQNKSGRGFIKASCVIDSTGDGDVAAAAGVPFFKGRETDGKMQPCTIMFKVGNVDYERAVFPGSFETLVETEKGELQALAKEILPFPAGHVLLYRQPEPGTVCVNMTNAIGIDATNAESLTEGVLTCRSQIMPILKFLREYVPGYEKCFLMSSASLIGIRETRHFEGIESLSAEDILEAKTYDNWVVNEAFFNFDVHNLTGASLDKTGVQKNWTQKGRYTIPYGCLLPKNVEGLLLSGRNISGSHLAHSNFRIMRVCIALGEAAGVAAALSIKQEKRLRDIDVKEIQKVVAQ